jgi:chromosome segregation ATPase
MKYNRQRLKQQGHRIEARIKMLNAQHASKIEMLNAPHAIKIEEQERQLAEVNRQLEEGDPRLADWERDIEKTRLEDEDYNNRIAWP